MIKRASGFSKGIALRKLFLSPSPDPDEIHGWEIRLSNCVRIQDAINYLLEYRMPFPICSGKHWNETCLKSPMCLHLGLRLWGEKTGIPSFSIAASALTEHFPYRLATVAFPKLNFLYLSTEYILLFIHLPTGTVRQDCLGPSSLKQSFPPGTLCVLSF